MAKCAGGLRGSGTRGRRAHGPIPALARAPRTPQARSAAAARAPAAIFPASRPARPRRAPARSRPAPVTGGARSYVLPLGQSARARFPGGGAPSGPAPRVLTATAARAGQRQARPGSELGWSSGLLCRGGDRECLSPGSSRGSRCTPALSVWRKAEGPGPAPRSPKPGAQDEPGAVRSGAANLAIAGENSGLALGVRGPRRVRAPLGSPV